MDRRTFLRKAKRIGLGAIGVYLVGRVAYCLLWEGHHLRVTRWEVPLPRLPADLDGLRIGFLSDIHLNPARVDPYVVHALDVLQGLDADAIVFTGDVLSRPPDHLSQYLDVFSKVDAPRGKYAVLGNHDIWENRAGPTTAFLRDAGWDVLRNRNTVLPGTKGRIRIAGVDDAVTGNDDLAATLRGVPGDALCILLSHTPDLIEDAAAAGVDLMLAGHTHGGQVVLPFLGPPVVPSDYGAKYAWGLFDHQGTRMVVTRGTGMIAPRIRFRCPPEVVELTLRRGDAELSEGGPERDLRPVVSKGRNGVRGLRKLLR